MASGEKERTKGKSEGPGRAGAFVCLGMKLLMGETWPRRLSIEIIEEAQGPSPADRDGRGRRGIREA